MSVIIFDFDGTLADSFQAALEIFYDVTGRENKLTTVDIERLRGSTVVHVASELNIKLWQMPRLLIQGRKLMGEKMSEVTVYQGITEVIKQLHKDGHKLFIMSTNSKRNIQAFLSVNGLEKLFIKVYGNVGILSKANVLKHLIKSQNLDLNDSWYVGDEVRDIHAAKKAGVRIISVGWGYNSAEVLSNYKPTKLISSPLEILNAIGNPKL
jgi:phosphoglycolate phosphatase